MAYYIGGSLLASKSKTDIDLLNDAKRKLMKIEKVNREKTKKKDEENVSLLQLESHVKGSSYEVNKLISDLKYMATRIRSLDDYFTYKNFNTYPNGQSHQPAGSRTYLTIVDNNSVHSILISMTGIITVLNSCNEIIKSFFNNPITKKKFNDIITLYNKDYNLWKEFYDIFEFEIKDQPGNAGHAIDLDNVDNIPSSSELKNYDSSQFVSINFHKGSLKWEYKVIFIKLVEINKEFKELGKIIYTINSSRTPLQSQTGGFIDHNIPKRYL